MSKTEGKATSGREQKLAFSRASVDVKDAKVRELIHVTDELLVSKGGKTSAKLLFTTLSAICDGYPMDVVASASVALVGHSVASYWAYLDVQRKQRANESAPQQTSARAKGRHVSKKKVSAA